MKDCKSKHNESTAPELVVMLTHDDMTVANVAQIFEQCKDSNAKYWGFKEKPLPAAEMKALLAEMKRCGKTTFLEVVEYTEAEGLAGAWAFTIGSAFFEGKFGKSFSQQINNVIDYMANDKNTKNEVVEYYDSIAKTYDESRFNNTYGRFIDAQERKVLDKLIDTAADGARLDMACGTGRLTNYATHGLDASAEMMASAQERHPAVEFRQASACDTGFEADSFDVVYSFHLLMHLDHDTIAKIFDEMGRIIKPGGRFVFDIPSSMRRNMLGHKQATWHGKFEMDTAAAMAFAAGKFELRRRFGIMMLPVHKLPVWMRKGLVKFDYLLANSFLREYSSYLVFEFVKK